MKKIDNDKVKEKSKGFIEEFKAFVLRGNVMDMAIGVIIGTAFAAIVTALTEDFINPLIDSIGGAEVQGKIAIWGGQSLNWGHFVTAIINFLIMALILFLMLKGVNKLVSKRKKNEEVAAPVKSDETILLEEIRDLLKKQNKK
ncbi:MAG: large conductance mechanosensitive channel protein MscL [Bacilli bacterium]|nr:large conductance mechanosensitive channel protein MscL [Bacilli bacterium]